MIDLRHGSPADRFHDDVRYSLRKAARNGIETRTTRDVRSLLDLRIVWAHGRSTRHNEAFLSALAHNGGIRIYEATKNDEVVSAIAVLLGRHHWFAVSFAQNDAGRRLLGGYATWGALIADCRAHGVPWLNMGASWGDDQRLAGVDFFKSKFGARLGRMETESVARSTAPVEEWTRSWLGRMRRARRSTL
jgi:Acetyltransferase (GNAT) domain